MRLGKRLQMLDNGKWRFVFCWVVNTGKICLTDSKRKGLPYNEDNLKYFMEKSHHLGEFRSA